MLQAPALVEKQLTASSRYCRPEIRDKYDLTPTQAQVAALIACRRTNAEIADILGISPNTARRHTEAVMYKLRVHSRLLIEEVLESELAPSIYGSYAG